MDDLQELVQQETGSIGVIGPTGVICPDCGERWHCPNWWLDPDHVPSDRCPDCRKANDAALLNDPDALEKIAPESLLLPEMVLEDIPVDQAVAFLVGYCARGWTQLRICKIEGDEIISLNMQHKTIVECLNLLAQMSDSVWSINPNGLFFFVKQIRASKIG